MAKTFEDFAFDNIAVAHASREQVLNESLLLVWTPNGRSAGEIYRLDAEKSEKSVKLRNNTEETLQHLYDVHSAAVGAGLGACITSPAHVPF